MYEIQCFDLHGNTINNLTQWDSNQSLVIPIDSLSLPESQLPSSPSYALPKVHFCNKTREEALVVQSEKHDDKSIKVKVPNALLQDTCPLQVYVYMTDSQDVTSQRTILHNEIPVRKKQKPSDYAYVENITYVTADMIKNEIRLSVANDVQDVIETITKRQEAEIGLIDEAKKKFDAACESIVKDATAIKTETEEIRDKTRAIAESAEEAITTKADKLIYENGINLKVTNNDGDVTLSIVVPELKEV